jgi:hypothetical protein
MSDEPEEDAKKPAPDEGAPSAGPKVGYGKPPVEHQFQKGKSGNARGRPPKKERSFTPRQLRRDILRFTEAPTTIRTEKGKQAVTAIEAILLRAISKALSGHGPSIRLIWKMHCEAILEHYQTHEGQFSDLERAEHLVTLKPSEVNNVYLAGNYLNNMRKLTRRT